MTKQEIFQTLIDILRPEPLRTMMEFNPNKAKVEMTKALQQTTMKLVGMGMYSAVVEHENYPNRVFKVSTSRWDGYRAYAKYCLENQGKELIPMVYSAQTQGNFGWYELEKYYPITKPQLTRSGMVQYVTKKVRNTVKVIQDAQYSLDPKSIKNYVDDENMTHSEKRKHIADLVRISELTENLYNKFRKEYRIDIHRGNMMVTIDNKVIITDPLAGDLRKTIPVTEEDPINV